MKKSYSVALVRMLATAGCLPVNAHVIDHRRQGSIALRISAGEVVPPRGTLRHRMGCDRMRATMTAEDKPPARQLMMPARWKSSTAAGYVVPPITQCEAVPSAARPHPPRWPKRDAP